MSEGCFAAIIVAIGTAVGAVITSIAGLVLALKNYQSGRYNSNRLDKLENGKDNH